MKAKAKMMCTMVVLGVAGMWPTGAAQAAGLPLSISANAGMVSDYRFRGVSHSKKKPAIQGGVHLDALPGLYAGVWGSTSKRYSGAAAEIDLYTGMKIPVGWMTGSVGVTGYIYPGARGADSVELNTALDAPLGPTLFTVGFSWAPSQGNMTGSNRYVYGAASMSLPGTPFTVKGAVGFERGGRVLDGFGETTSKTDYRLGVEANLDRITVGVSYVGNNMPGKRPLNWQSTDNLVLSIGTYF